MQRVRRHIRVSDDAGPHFLSTTTRWKQSTVIAQTNNRSHNKLAMEHTFIDKYEWKIRLAKSIFILVLSLSCFNSSMQLVNYLPSYPTFTEPLFPSVILCQHIHRMAAHCHCQRNPHPPLFS